MAYVDEYAKGAAVGRGLGDAAIAGYKGFQAKREDQRQQAEAQRVLGSGELVLGTDPQARSAVQEGMQEWRSIQADRASRKEFGGIVDKLAKGEQGIAAIMDREGSNLTPQERVELEQTKALRQRYAQVAPTVRPIPGQFDPDTGAPAQEAVIETPEGIEISIERYGLLSGKEMQALVKKSQAQADLWMQALSRYPNNRYLKEHIGQRFAQQQRQLDQELKGLQARSELEERYFAEKLQADREAQNAAFKRDADIALERERAGLDTNLEREKSRLRVQEGREKPDGPSVFERQILVDTYKQGGKDIEAAQGAIDTLSQIDATLERAEQVFAEGGVSTGALEGSTLGAFVQRLTNEEGVNVAEQAFGAEFLQAVQSMRGLGQLSDRDAQALTRTTGGLDKDETFNLADLRRRRATLREIIGRKAQEREIAVRNREAVLEQGQFEGIQTKGRAPSVSDPDAGAPDENAETPQARAAVPPVPQERAAEAAQIKAAYRAGQIERDEALRRLEALGGE